MLDQLFLPLHLDISDIVYEWVKRVAGGGRGRRGRGVKRYLVFEIASGTARLKKYMRIPKNDSFSSFIDHILKIRFKVCNITTNLFLCNANKFARMFLQMLSCERIKLKLNKKKKRKGDCITNGVVSLFICSWMIGLIKDHELEIVPIKTRDDQFVDQF